MPTTFTGHPPPSSSLGAWLLKQVQELVNSVAGLVAGQAEQGQDVKALKKTVAALKANAERSRKVQDMQGLEIESIKLNLAAAKKQINGLKISRGHYKAKAEKVIDTIEQRLN